MLAVAQMESCALISHYNSNGFQFAILAEVQMRQTLHTALVLLSAFGLSASAFAADPDKDFDKKRFAEEVMPRLKADAAEPVAA